MANYAVVRTDLMSGTKDPSQLVNLRYMGSNGSTETAIENGHVVVLAGLSDERDVYKAVDPKATNVLDELYLVASVENMPDERKKNLHEFRNEVGGRAARGYRLHKGGWFSATAEAFEGTPVVGQYATIQAGTKLKVTESPTAEKIAGKFEAIETVGTDKFYVVRITDTKDAE